ncbi:MAG: glycosyltransferase [Dorea sp.]|nr:glycosyltransferase [Dorea sp.]
MMKNVDVVIIIPAYNPDKKLLVFLGDLIKAGYNKIIIIDDGSKEETRQYFNEAKSNYHCVVLFHSINLGQGRAYKTGFNYYLSECKQGGDFENTIGIIQCDCDGQHHIDDINACTELLRQYPDKFILGVRDFSNKNVPFRSRFGNNCTTFIFKSFCGLNISDTQTGLKGIPASFIPKLMETSGERFEYASSVLLETKRQGIEIIQFPIQTIYINGNETSHFNPLFDSIRIYSLIFKYLISSLSAFIVDVIAFSIFLSIFRKTIDNYIIAATYMSKLISCTYSFFVNKNLVFHNRSKFLPAVFKYTVLCVIQASLSGILVDKTVCITAWHEITCKVIVDTILFFLSYQVQNRWVFSNGN